MKTTLKAKPLKSISKIKKLPSGVFDFDVLTKGGIAEGRFSLFWGMKSSGKTTMSLRLARSFLESFPDRKVCYLDFEQAFDPEWAIRILGKDYENFEVFQPEYAEEAIDFLKDVALPDPTYGLYIIDSLASIIPISEAEASAEQDFMGLQARVINKMLRKMLPFVSKHTREGYPTFVILINQARANLKGGYGAQYTKPGGYLQEFMASLEVRFYQAGIEKVDNRPAILKIEFIIEKNKTGGIPKMVGEMKMALIDFPEHSAGDVIDDTKIINFLKEHNLLQKEKNEYVLFTGKVYRTQAELKRELNELKPLIVEKAIEIL